MKLECKKDKIKEIINLSEKVAGKNLALPILSTVLLEAKGNVLSVKATNLDVGLEFGLTAKIDEEGTVAVTASVLGSFLNNLNKEENIKIEEKNGNLHISTGSTKTLIKCLSAEDFPVIPRVKEKNKYVLKAGELVAGLKSVAYAAALTDIKPEISSVYLYQEGRNLIFVSTDSFRLAEKTIYVGEKGSDFIPIIIPFKNVNEIIRVFDGREGDVSIESDKHQVSFYSDEIHLTSRVIDGIFPDYRQIMPNKFNTEVSIPKDDLINALKLSNIFVDRLNQIVLKVAAKGSKLELTSQNQDVGENTITLNAKVEGDDQEMHFNVKYILDCFQSIPSGTINLNFARPLLVKGSDDGSFKYIVMPVIK